MPLPHVVPGSGKLRVTTRGTFTRKLRDAVGKTLIERSRRLSAVVVAIRGRRRCMPLLARGLATWLQTSRTSAWCACELIAWFGAGERAGTTDAAERGRAACSRPTHQTRRRNAKFAEEFSRLFAFTVNYLS